MKTHYLLALCIIGATGAYLFARLFTTTTTSAAPIQRVEAPPSQGEPEVNAPESETGNRRQEPLLEPGIDSFVKSQVLNTEDQALAEIPEEDRETHFKWQRETLTSDQLMEELHGLQAELLEQTMDEVTRRVSEGEYQPIRSNEDGSFSLREVQNRDLVEIYSNDADGNPIKVVLPQSKFPEAYVTQKKITWIEDLLAKAGGKPQTSGRALRRQ